MEFLNAFGAFVIGLVSFLIGIIIGGTVADYRIDRKMTKAQKDPAEGISSAEAYMEGFSDGYYELDNREPEFAKVGFGMRYIDGLRSGHDKRNSERDIELAKEESRKNN